MKGLPQGGAFHRSLRPESFGWTHTDELLAVLAELVDYSNRLFMLANTKKGTKLPDPLQINRPGEDPQKRKDAAKNVKRKPTHEEVVRFFGGKR